MKILNGFGKFFLQNIKFLYIVVFIIKVLMEKELFVIYIKIFIDIESINGVFLEFLIFGFVCLKECLIFNLMMYGIREFQSFVVGGSVIRQKGYVFNVLVIEENFMLFYKVIFVKIGMKMLLFNRYFYFILYEFL